MSPHLHLSGKKILQVLPSLETGGVERGTLEMAEAIISSGGKSLVLSNGGQLVQPLKNLGAIHIKAPVHSKNPFQIYKNISLIRQLIKKQNIDLVHVRSRAPAWSVYFACQAANIPFITTFHGTYGYTGFLGIKKIYNKIMLKGQCVIANSYFIANHLSTIYKTPNTCIRIIPRGVDIKKFSQEAITPQQKKSLLKSWELPVSKAQYPLILLPGRLTRWKGQLVFLQALEQLPHRRFLALLVGSNQGRTAYLQEIETFIKQHKLENNVKIVDHCSDMPTAYSLSDFVVSASTNPEAFGRIMAEAGALGKLVIATNHGGSTEIILQNKTGFLVDPGSPNSLKKGLETAFSLSKKDYKSVGSQARKRVVELFSKEVFQNKTLKVYQDVLEYSKLKAPL